jgi:hypothetical protein
MLMMRPQPKLLHARQRCADGVEVGRQVDGQDLFPLGHRELVHRRHVLDASVVDQDVDGAVPLLGFLHHARDLLGLSHVGHAVRHRHLEFVGQAGAQLLDLGRVAEAV